MWLGLGQEQFTMMMKSVKLHWLSHLSVCYYLELRSAITI